MCKVKVGIVLGLAIVGIITGGAFGAFLNENFEDATFPPDGWTTSTPQNTWITHSIGHNGTGGNGGYGLSMDDYNSSRYCMVKSPVYDTEDPIALGFDFNNAYNSGSVLFLPSISGNWGAYMNWVEGVVYYYYGGWQHVSKNGNTGNFVTVNTTPDQWQRVRLEPQQDGSLVMTLTDMTTGTTQVSDPFPTYDGANPGQMQWWTNTNDTIIYAIDNVWTASVPEPASLTMLGLGLFAACRRRR